MTAHYVLGRSKHATSLNMQRVASSEHDAFAGVGRKVSQAQERNPYVMLFAQTGLIVHVPNRIGNRKRIHSIDDPTQ